MSDIYRGDNLNIDYHGTTASNVHCFGKRKALAWSPMFERANLSNYRLKATQLERFPATLDTNYDFFLITGNRHRGS